MKQIEKKIRTYLSNEYKYYNDEIDSVSLDTYLATIVAVNGGYHLFNDNFYKDISSEAKSILNSQRAALIAQSIVDNSKQLTVTFEDVIKHIEGGGSLSSYIRYEKRKRRGKSITIGKRNMKADAYFEMSQRTALTKAKLEKAKQYGLDNGLDLFQVSAHSGARELCYPWQGKIVSWSGKSGTFIDMNGNEIEYISINDTSYGEPAGLFGINCHHEAYPVDTRYFVDNISETVPNKVENEKQKEYLRSKRKRS